MILAASGLAQAFISLHGRSIWAILAYFGLAWAFISLYRRSIWVILAYFGLTWAFISLHRRSIWVILAYFGSTRAFISLHRHSIWEILGYSGLAQASFRSASVAFGRFGPNLAWPGPTLHPGFTLAQAYVSTRFGEGLHYVLALARAWGPPLARIALVIATC